MNDFIISTDATSDLPICYLQEHDVKLISMLYTIAGKDYFFGNGEAGLTYPEFYQLMRQGEMPKTAQITPQQATDHFEKFLSKNIDVLHIAFSSALSGSAESCKKAAEELNAKYSSAKVVVVDSLCASLGEGLYVDYAVRQKAEGKTMREIADYLETHKQNLCHYFTVDDLHHLHRGGRVSKFTAIVGTLLKIKPLLHVDETGRLIPIAKAKGRKKSLEWLADKMAERFNGDNGQRVFISHGDCLEDAEYVAELLRSRLKIKDFMIDYIGPVVGAHSGPGTVAMFFMGEKRSEKKGQ